jgi:hypothetical protein
MQRPPLPTKTAPMRSHRPERDRTALAPWSVEQSFLRSSRDVLYTVAIPGLPLSRPTNGRATANRAELLNEVGTMGEQCFFTTHHPVVHCSVHPRVRATLFQDPETSAENARNLYAAKSWTGLGWTGLEGLEGPQFAAPDTGVVAPAQGTGQACSSGVCLCAVVKDKAERKEN